MSSESKSLLVDLREVQAPYVRLMGEHGKLDMRGNGVIQQWELRFTQPNRSHLNAKTMHSLEHMLAKHIQLYLPRTLEVAPMGCATGFRLLVLEALVFSEMKEALLQTLADILAATKVPAAEDWRCGQVDLHSLEEAQMAAAAFLAAAGKWDQVVSLAK